MDVPPLPPSTEAFFAAIKDLAVVQDCGRIDLADPDPRRNGFRGPWHPRIQAKVADVYVGEKFQDRSILLRDGSRMPDFLFKGYADADRLRHSRN